MRGPKRSLGQNFLVDPNYRRKISDAARVDYKGETLVEIGPGKGAITEHLLEFAQRLVLVEKDRDLGQALAEKYASDGRVQVVIADFLDWDLSILQGQENRVVANLPYNVSTQILLKLLKHMHLFSRLVLMFQKEVALRCVAEQGTREGGILSAWCHLLARPRRLFDVPPNAFRPRPNVVSTIVEFLPSETRYDGDVENLMTFIKKLFSQRRKKIGGLIKAERDRITDPILKSDLDKRAEELRLEELQALFRAIRAVPESN